VLVAVSNPNPNPNPSGKSFGCPIGITFPHTLNVRMERAPRSNNRMAGDAPICFGAGGWETDNPT